MTSFVSRKKPFGQRKEKVPKIKSLLLENSLNTINNRRYNNILYKEKSRHLVRWNTALIFHYFLERTRSQKLDYEFSEVLTDFEHNFIAHKGTISALET